MNKVQVNLNSPVTTHLASPLPTPNQTIQKTKATFVYANSSSSYLPQAVRPSINEIDANLTRAVDAGITSRKKKNGEKPLSSKNKQQMTPSIMTPPQQIEKSKQEHQVSSKYFHPKIAPQPNRIQTKVPAHIRLHKKSTHTTQHMQPPKLISTLEQHKEYALYRVNKLKDRLTSEGKISNDEILKGIWELKKQIKAIVKDSKLSTNKKCEELALLAFYASRSREIPVLKGSYLDHRYEEIKEREQKYHKIHRTTLRSENQNNLSIGSLQYLMRALSRMIIQSGSTILLGGCQAVKELLQEKYLGFMLSSQDREHILSIIEDIKTTSNIQTSLTHTYKNIPLISQEIIKIELKLEKNTSLTSLDYQYALLIALLSLAVQTDEGNCYAIANYNKISCNDLNTIIRAGITIIENGGYLFEGLNVSLRLLLESHCIDENDFETEINSFDDVAETAVIKTVSALLNEGTIISSLEDQTLNDFINENFPKNERYAKKVITSFKKSLLKQAILNALRFYIINSDTKRTGFLSCKQLITNALFDDIFNSPALENIALSLRAKKDFCDLIKTNFIKKFYFVNYRHSQEKIVNGRVMYPHHQKGLIYNGDIDKYSKCRENTRLFMRTQDNKLEPVDCISQLGKEITDIVSSSYQEIITKNPSKKNELKPYFEATQNTLAEFNNICSKSLKKLNRNILLDEAVYKDADSFFIVSDGADPRSARDWKNDLYADSMKRAPENPCFLQGFESKSIKDFILNLFESYYLYAKDNVNFFDKSNQNVLFNLDSHAFTGFPNTTRDIWNGNEEHRKKYLEQLETRMLNILNGNNAALKNHILNTIVTHSDARNIILNSEVFKTGSINDFRLFLRDKIRDDQLVSFDQIFHQMLYEINPTDLKIHLDKIFSNLHSSFKNTDVASRFKQIIEKDSTWFTGYEFGLRIQQFLQMNGLHYVNIDQIEKVISDACNHPRYLNFGILNWVEFQSETPDFQYFNAAFDPNTKEWKLYIRSKQKIEELDPKMQDEILDIFRVIYPSIS